jgi:hypothetical protein
MVYRHNRSFGNVTLRYDPRLSIKKYVMEPWHPGGDSLKNIEDYRATPRNASLIQKIR